MARDWERWFENSTGPASATEEDDRDRTERKISKAILAHPELAGNVRIFVKGSYATATNIRRDSDVDIAVEWKSWSYIDKAFQAEKMTWSQLGVSTTDAGPSPRQYRGWVEQALFDAFGYSDVDPGNKAITVEGGSSTLDADVVPCFTHTRYDNVGESHQGIRLFPRDGGVVENWPEQNRVNGIQKNSDTKRWYKRMVRAFKRLENDMVNQRILREEVPGYLVECLLWNCRNGSFLEPTYKETAKALLLHLWAGLQDEVDYTRWGEVNELKYLFRGDGALAKRDLAFGFVDKAYDYIFDV